jgi:hypothetical protein
MGCDHNAGLRQWEGLRKGRTIASGGPLAMLTLAHFARCTLPGNRVMRVMDRSVHQAALASACEKLLELGRKSGKKEPAL